MLSLWRLASVLEQQGVPQKREAGANYCSGGVKSDPEDVDTPVVGCLCHGALSEWYLGEISCCKANMDEAISLARELNDVNALALALTWAAAMLACAERNPPEVERLASDLIELSTRHNFVYWLAVGTIWRGWARSASGDTAEGIPWIEQGIRDYRATGVVPGLPVHCFTYKTGEATYAEYRRQKVSASGGRGFRLHLC